MKKIINTILGVLVRIFWKLNDLANRIIDNLDFIFHWKKNKQEMEDFELERLNHRKEFEYYQLQRKKEYNEILKKCDNYEIKISKLETNIITKSNRIMVLEERLQDVNNQYIEVFHNYTETSVELTKLKESFNKTRGKLGGVQAENNKLSKENEELTAKLVSAREELIKTKNKIKFIESKLPKKTLEEIVAYTFSQKEVLKRNKKNDRQD